MPTHPAGPLMRGGSHPTPATTRRRPDRAPRHPPPPPPAAGPPGPGGPRLDPEQPPPHDVAGVVDAAGDTDGAARPLEVVGGGEPHPQCALVEPDRQQHHGSLRGGGHESTATTR